MLCMRSKAWLAAPVLLTHAEVTHNILSMGPKLRYSTVVAAPDLLLRSVGCLHRLPDSGLFALL